MKLEKFRTQLDELKEYSEEKKELKLQFDLAKAVLRARINKGWSQKQLADAIGTKQANISRIEAGLSNPTLNLIKKLSAVLEINIEISFGKVAEIEYISKPRTMNSQFIEFFTLAMSIENCTVFDSIASQSKTQENIFA